MPDTKLPSHDHVLRFASSNRLQRDDAGNVIALAPTAFQLRDVDQGLLSVTWIEHFGSEIDVATVDAVRAYRRSMSSPLGKNSAFGKAKVEVVIQAGLNHHEPIRLRVLHEPTELNTGHATVHRYRIEDEELMELLATEAFTEIILNKDIAD